MNSYVQYSYTQTVPLHSTVRSTYRSTVLVLTSVRVCKREHLPTYLLAIPLKKKSNLKDGASSRLPTRDSLMKGLAVLSLSSSLARASVYSTSILAQLRLGFVLNEVVCAQGQDY